MMKRSLFSTNVIDAAAAKTHERKTVTNRQIQLVFVCLLFRCHIQTSLAAERLLFYFASSPREQMRQMRSPFGDTSITKIGLIIRRCDDIHPERSFGLLGPNF